MIYDDNLKEIPELDEIGKWVENNDDGFLSSIYNNAQKYKLSDRQIYSAKKAWDKIKNPPVIIDISKEQRKALVHIIDKYVPMNYYNPQEFLRDIAIKLEHDGNITDKQYNLMTKKLYKYRKSILRKIFKGV